MAIRQAFLSLTLLLIAANLSSAATIYSQTQSGSVGAPSNTPVVLTFTGTIPAASDATLTLIAQPGGELFNNGKRLENLIVDGNASYSTPGKPVGWISPFNFLDEGNPAQPVAPVTIPLADLSGFVADGQVVVSVVRPNFISGGVFDLILEYTSSIPEPSSCFLAMVGMAGVVVLGRQRRI